jgi:hypothetical protein
VVIGIITKVRPPIANPYQNNQARNNRIAFLISKLPVNSLFTFGPVGVIISAKGLLIVESNLSRSQQDRSLEVRHAGQDQCD